MCKRLLFILTLTIASLGSISSCNNSDSHPSVTDTLQAKSFLKNEKDSTITNHFAEHGFSVSSKTHLKELLHPAVGFRDSVYTLRLRSTVDSSKLSGSFNFETFKPGPADFNNDSSFTYTVYLDKYSKITRVREHDLSDNNHYTEYFRTAIPGKTGFFIIFIYSYFIKDGKDYSNLEHSIILSDSISKQKLFIRWASPSGYPMKFIHDIVLLDNHDLNPISMLTFDSIDLGKHNFSFYFLKNGKYHKHVYNSLLVKHPIEYNLSELYTELRTIPAKHKLTAVYELDPDVWW